MVSHTQNGVFNKTTRQQGVSSYLSRWDKQADRMQRQYQETLAGNGQSKHVKVQFFSPTGLNARKF